MTKRILATLLFPFAASLYGDDGSGTISQLQTWHDTEGGSPTVDGDTYTLTTSTATASVNISKGVIIKGSDNGLPLGPIAQSRTSLTIGTGSKVFTLYSASGNVDTDITFTGGETIRAVRPDDSTVYMEGTVTSYSDPTLTLSIATSSGSGTDDYWIIHRPPSVVITNNVASGGDLFNVTSDATHNIVFEEFGVTNIGAAGGTMFDLGGSGEPVIWRYMHFRISGSAVVIDSAQNAGLVHDSGFDVNYTLSNGSSNTQGVRVKMADGAAPSDSSASWGSASTMGDDDTDGESNFYVEDNYFMGFRHAATDCDDGGRIVWRYNVMAASGLAGHGSDTSNYGARHLEIYNNQFLHKDDGTGKTLDLSNGWWYVRGGTGLFANNYVEQRNTGDFSAASTWKFQIQNIQRSAGLFGCYGEGNTETSYPASDYPSPRQIGFGYVDGTGSTDASYGYLGDSEPIYIWGNTGTLTAVSGGLNNYDVNGCTNADQMSAYIEVGASGDIREATKPSWTAYTYPHPLAGGAAAATSTLKRVTGAARGLLQ